MHRRSAGFSFVEIILAIGLASLVILTAASGFRAAMQSMTLLNRTSEENRLLRSGIIMALDDLDHWSSDADPAFPYGHAYASFRNVSDDGLTKLPDVPVNDHANNRRLFRRVSFQTALRDTNADGHIDMADTTSHDPNWQLPHEPASWYRGHLLPNARPVQLELYNPSRFTAPWQDRSIASNQRTASWNWCPPPPAALPTGSYRPRTPNWWNPRLCFGDFANFANTSCNPSDYTAGLAGLTMTAADAALRGSRGAQLQALYRDLGPIGLATYVLPGTMLQYLRPTTHLYDGSGLNYDRGEVPWMLATPKLPQGATGDWQTSTSVPGGARLDFLEGMGFFGSLYATDLTAAMMHRVVLYGTQIRADQNPMSTLHAAARRGWLDGMDQEPAKAYLRCPVARTAAEAYRNTTSLLPLGLTNQPSIDLEAPSDRPSMSMSSYRYRYRGGDLCNLAVTLSDPRTGRTILIGFSAVGTTFRGARQLWALRTWGQDFSGSQLTTTGAAMPAMGDYYAP
jgi:hypothetical protein